MVDFLKKHIQNQKNILAINAAIPHMFGLNEIKENYPKHYKDVGIAEQESIAFVAGAVKEGITPPFGLKTLLSYNEHMINFPMMLLQMIYQ